MSDLIEELRILAETNIAASNRTLTVAADALEANAKRIAELDADNARLRVDGERYAWLRQDCPWTLLSEVFNIPPQDENTYEENMVWLDKEVDAAVDAARKEQS